MSISAVGSAASFVPQVSPQNASAPPARSSAPARVGSDSDGDNDGTKGRTVDVRA